MFCYAAEEAVTVPALTEFYRALSRMGREANQGEVGVVIDADLFARTLDVHAGEASTRGCAWHDMTQPHDSLPNRRAAGPGPLASVRRLDSVSER